MNRVTTGAALGALTMYLLDPEHGQRRRKKVSATWRVKSKPAMEAGQTAAQSLQPLAKRVTRELADSRPWTRRPAPRAKRFGAGSTIGLILAAGAGGAIVYFLDPERGAERRQRLLATWQEKRQATLEASQRTAAGAAQGFRQATGQAVGSVRNGIGKAQSRLG